MMCCITAGMCNHILICGRDKTKIINHQNTCNTLVCEATCGFHLQTKLKGQKYFHKRLLRHLMDNWIDLNKVQSNP